MGTAADVRVASVGEIFAGSSTATLPTSPLSAVPGGYENVGFISENGVTMSITQNTNEIKEWSGSTVRKVQTSHLVEVKFEMIETNFSALDVYYGDANVDDVNGIVKITSIMNYRGRFIIDVEDGSDVTRLVLPDGEVTTHDDVLYKNAEATFYGVAITCYPDPADGVTKVYQYYHTAGIS